ncbi:MAG: putative glycoside hydrolase [Oscillospiraceae bacterium]|nr:putative glycoside hydrolase [Oscillospiraceae bacterium]
MAKGQKKIKRYRRIYGGRSTLSKVMGVVLTFVILTGVACLGWALYEPVSQFLSGTMQAQEDLRPSQPMDTTLSAVDSAPEQPQEPPQPETLDLSQMHGVYLPLSALQDAAALSQTLVSLKQQGVNCILIDAKNSQGQVLYQSANQTVAQVAAQIVGAVDLAQVTSLAADNGITVIARIYAFRDPLCPLVLKTAAVKYQDTEMLWLDNSKENGGKSWMNPYSEIAQMYVADLSLECIRAGCGAVMLDGVQFPTGYSLELAGYGAQTKSRQQVLSDFVVDMQELLEENGGRLVYASSAQAMLGMEAASYESGGLTYPVQNFCPDLRPASLVSGGRPESLTMADPVSQPYDAVKAVLTQLQGSGEGKTFLPLLQAYTAPATTLEYTAVQIEEQIRALKESGVTGYILYNEQGSYSLL